MYSLIIYQAFTNPYMRLVRVADGGVVASADWSIAKDTAWGSSDITLAKDSIIGGIPVTISEDLEAGDYDMLFYDAASPADTDTVQVGKRIAWSGNKLLGLPMDI
jgi:hypothetical protein